MAVQQKIWLFLPIKTFATTSYVAVSFGVLCRNNYKKEAHMMNKLLQRNKKKKKFYTGMTDLPVPLNGRTEVTTEKALNHRTPRRVSVLNKLFMKNITDILATGSSCTNLIGWNLEITRVAVSADYKVVNVYWLCPDINRDLNSLEKKLVEAGNILRHELTKLTLMGHIPRIIFVKDKRQLMLMEVEDILNRADKGQHDLETEYKEESSKNVLPPMSTDVLELNRTKIIDKIKSDLKRYKIRSHNQLHSDEGTESTNVVIK